MKKYILILLVILFTIVPALAEPVISSNPIIEYDFVNYDGSWQELLQELNCITDLDAALPGTWCMDTALLVQLTGNEEKIVWNFHRDYSKDDRFAVLLINEDHTYEYVDIGIINRTTNEITFDFSFTTEGIGYCFIFRYLPYINLTLKF